MIDLAVALMAVFATGLFTGYRLHQRKVMKALERLAHPAATRPLDHDAIRNLVTQYRFPSGQGVPPDDQL